MSQENLATLRRFGSAWQRGDREAHLAEVHPAAELTTDSRWIDGGAYRGREEVGKFFDDYAGAFSPEGGETEDLLEVDDKILVRFIDKVSGRASGVVTQNAFTAVYTFKDGMIVRIQYFLDHADALEAVGLSE